MLLGGNRELAEQLALLFTAAVKDPARFTPEPLTEQELKSIRKTNLEIANSVRNEQWEQTCREVTAIIQNAKAVDPDVSTTELCVRINQEKLPTYRPGVYPSWTPSMVGRFIRKHKL